MSGKKREHIKIVSTYMTNPFESGQGGGVRYVRNLLKQTDADSYKVLFFGIGPKKKVLGNTTLIPVTSRKYCGYPYFLIRLILLLPFIDLSSYKVVHVHRSYFAIPFLLLKPHLKVICSLHGRTFSVFEENYGKKLMRLTKLFFSTIECYALKRIDFLVPVSKDVVRSFSAKYPSLMAARKKETAIIGSMLDLSSFKPVVSDYLAKLYGKEYKYILFLGRLASVKDIDFLINLWSSKFQASNNIKFVLVGRGENEDRYRNLALRICPSNAPIFHGAVASDDVPKLINSSSIVLLSSQHEASPTVVKEALASGIPVVSNQIGDVDEFILNGKNGYVVEKNYLSYYDAISKLLSDPISPEEVELASRASLSKCSISYVGSEYINIYNRLADLENLAGDSL
jgi:L-malate glycosyltransferase